MRVQKLKGYKKPCAAIVGEFVWGAQRCNYPTSFETLDEFDNGLKPERLPVCIEHIEQSR